MNIKAWYNALLFNLFTLSVASSSLLIGIILQIGGLTGILMAMTFPVWTGALILNLIITVIFFIIIAKRHINFSFGTMLLQRNQMIKNIFRILIYILILADIITATFDCISGGTGIIEFFVYNIFMNITFLLSFIGFSVFMLNICVKKTPQS